MTDRNIVGKHMLQFAQPQFLTIAKNRFDAIFAVLLGSPGRSILHIFQLLFLISAVSWKHIQRVCDLCSLGHGAIR